eukprot:scaffold6819_cov51-Attheya_sp.AAC.11
MFPQSRIKLFNAISKSSLTKKGRQFGQTPDMRQIIKKSKLYNWLFYVDRETHDLLDISHHSYPLFTSMLNIIFSHSFGNQEASPSLELRGNSISPLRAIASTSYTRYRSRKTVAWSELSMGLNTQITQDKVAHHGVLVRYCPCAINPLHSTKLFSHGNNMLERKANAALDWSRCPI